MDIHSVCMMVSAMVYVLNRW